MTFIVILLFLLLLALFVGGLAAWHGLIAGALRPLERTPRTAGDQRA